jgi:antitoxin VapB
MNINSPKLDELARRLATRTGEDVETAVERALKERLARVPSGEPGRKEVMRRFFDNVSRMPVKDDRPIDEIVGYGPDGLPS